MNPSRNQLESQNIRSNSSVKKEDEKRRLREIEFNKKKEEELKRKKEEEIRKQREEELKRQKEDLKKLKQTDKAKNPQNKIWFDPGIGFGKNLNQNLLILKNIKKFKLKKCGLLLGSSKKSWISGIDNSPVEKRIGGSIASVLYCLNQGVDIFRVHDVFEIHQAIKVYRRIRCLR